jgi:hypothetical protein
VETSFSSTNLSSQIRTQPANSVKTTLKDFSKRASISYCKLSLTPQLSTYQVFLFIIIELKVTLDLWAEATKNSWCMMPMQIKF